MDSDGRRFLDELLDTPTPAGYEAAAQRRWVDRVREDADAVRTDAYGNAVAVSEGAPDAPTIAFAGHVDEIGLIVRRIDDDGYLHPDPVGGMDRSVTKGQYVTVHGDDGPVPGVIGQTAIHQRDRDDDTVADLNEQRIDVGAADEEAARDLVSVGDPVTVDATPADLDGSLLAARGLDNRAGVWAAAEGLRRAAAADVDATVIAVSTVQEELGLQGARMVGYDLANDVDAIVAVDVTHATDNPESEADEASDVSLGDGPAVARGSANHPALVDLARRAATDGSIDVQLTAAGSRTGTDTDAFYTQRGGVPALRVGVPNRYMHTPVEVVDLDDLDDAADLLAAMAGDAASAAPFAVDV